MKIVDLERSRKTTDNQNELFVVVDKNDNILGYKTRGECHSNTNIIHRGIGIVIFNDKNEVLLQKRSMTKDTYPGWFTDSTGGHVARGESYRQTAKREVFEEIGIKPKLKFIGTCMYHGINETEIDGIFTAIHNGPFKLNKKEVTSVKFVSQKSLKQIRSKLTPSAIVSFEKIGLL